MNLNSPPSSHFPMHHENDHRDLYHLQDRASSLSCHFFFDPTTQDQTAFYDHRELYQTNHVPDESYNYGGGSTYDEMKNKVDSGAESSNPMKWMSSKMRLIQKMKNNEDDEINNKVQVHQPSSSDLSSNSSSYNTTSPIRVCSDCNTTKTPLWRSGPKGPKSLCNACGIRQRKARRAMAAAAAAASGGGAATSTDQYSPTKIKLQNKGKLGKNGHASQIKKRCRAAASPPSNGQKQLGFEDFLINLSKNLAFQRVFPDDVKDAAILLMALSSGLVNG